MDEFFGSQISDIRLTFFMCPNTFTQSIVSRDFFWRGTFVWNRLLPLRRYYGDVLWLWLLGLGLYLRFHPLKEHLGLDVGMCGEYLVGRCQDWIVVFLS